MYTYALFSLLSNSYMRQYCHNLNTHLIGFIPKIGTIRNKTLGNGPNNCYNNRELRYSDHRDQTYR